MPGLVPGIHIFLRGKDLKDVDGRDICAKTRFALLPGHDAFPIQGNARSSKPLISSPARSTAPYMLA
jgi:hypothetical protein